MKEMSFAESVKLFFSGLFGLMSVPFIIIYRLGLWVLIKLGLKEDIYD